MDSQKEIRNIGILAHVDAGKTTITENFLFLGGRTKSIGSVDNGTTQTDFLDVEKQRGISVRSAVTTFQWQGVQINLADTPGHVDFSSEVERILRVIDGAILVISAVEGVQAHTETIWNALQNRNIPVLIFINKIDRLGADVNAVIAELRKLPGSELILLTQAINEGEADADIIELLEFDQVPEKLMEQIATQDEIIFEQFFEGRILNRKDFSLGLQRCVHKNKLKPVFSGSAKNSIGISALLDAVIQFLPPPDNHSSDKLSALVFSISHDKTMGKIANVRIFSGSIRNREVINNLTSGEKEKVTQVRRLLSGKFEDAGSVTAGDIAGICGLATAKSGDILGDEDLGIPVSLSMKTPLLTVQVRAAADKDYPALAEALFELSEEDPMLGFYWLREEKELHVNIMGWIQIEILEHIIASRFGIKANFENPTVIYKETPSSQGIGFVQYWMPKPCWAILKFQISPGERGSGMVYESKVGVNDVKQKYQNEVERTISQALQQGIKGWEVTDLRITLIEGEDHEMHSRPGDFVVATPMGIMNGLVSTGTTLLEPLISFRISAPEALLGAIASDITQMRGSFESPEIANEKILLTGILPVATSLEYAVKLSSRSGGKAKISTKFHGYQLCPDELGVIRSFKGISPLDTAKYILKARKALH